jgi:hypothetical protein
MPIMPIYSALVAAFQWSRCHPQAIGYGAFLIVMAQFRVGDLIMMAVGIVAVIGGILAAWEFVNSPKKSE